MVKSRMESSLLLNRIAALEELIQQEQGAELGRLTEEEARHSALLQRLEALALRAAALQSELILRGTRIEHLETELRSYAADIATLQSELTQRDQRLAAVYRSTSWRLMRPVRALLRLLRGQIRLADVVRHVRRSARARFSKRVNAGPNPPAARAEDPAQAPAPAPVNRPRQGRPLRFPLTGRITTLPEVVGTKPAFVDLSVSVVIPTFNAGTELEWLARKLQAQKGIRSVEIVVVDSGSSDG